MSYFYHNMRNLPTFPLRQLLSISKVPVISILFIVISVVLPYSAFSQIQLAFTGTPSVSGTAGAVGTQYTYSNVGSTSGITIKAVIEILSTDGAGLDNIDGPVSSGGTDNAWQPVIYGSKTSGNCWSMVFRIRFYNASSNAALVLSSFQASGIDIDGNGGTLREHNTFYYPYSYTLDNPTNLTFTNTAGVYRFQAPSQSYTGIALNQTNVAVTTTYTNRSSVDISIGSCCVGGSCSVAANAGRQHSINFYDAVPYTSPVVLPMTLEKFEASIVNEKILLTWETLEEINLDRFIIQRSADGLHFSDIASVSAKQTASSYKYYDNTVKDGKYYYRLKAMDIDGKFTYSPIVAQSNNTDQQSAITARISNGQVHAIIRSSNRQHVKLVLVTSQGQVIKTISSQVGIGTGAIIMQPPAMLSRGIYFLRISSDQGWTKTLKIN